MSRTTAYGSFGLVLLGTVVSGAFDTLAFNNNNNNNHNNVYGYSTSSQRRRYSRSFPSVGRRTENALVLNMIDSFRSGGRRDLLEEPSDYNENDRLSSVNRRHGGYRDEWGVSREANVNDFPSTARAVVDRSFEAIAGTIHNNHKLDPNIASNAMSESIITHRPVRTEVDSGRIGIEIDGAKFLFPNNPKITAGRATRKVALLLAAKLSMDESWEDFEGRNSKRRKNKYRKKHSRQRKETDPPLRPVLVYCNTIKQALSASQELSRLKEAERRRTGGTKDWSKFDEIIIKPISDDIPSEMCYTKTERRRYGGLTTGEVDASRGIVMFIQPTDFNVENLPPGPAVGTVNRFQQLVAQTTVEELPTIVLSPRFMATETPYGGGWDQSGYQKSATYGGVEPPKGPTPWVMRDFTPPSYCWVANAATVGRLPRGNNDYVQCMVTRVALTQTVMDSGHQWHIFAAHECSHGEGTPVPDCEYLYLASTKSAFGRPTRELIFKILEDI